MVPRPDRFQPSILEDAFGAAGGGVGTNCPPLPAKGPDVFRLIKRSPWLLLGAGVAWFADPVSGRTRRDAVRAKLSEATDASPLVDNTNGESPGPVSRDRVLDH